LDEPSQAQRTAEIKAFALQFDPQPFHTDEKAAEGTFFKGVAARGGTPQQSPCA
jgi:acyl dehydratase